MRGDVKPLPQLPPGWLVAYNDYFAESGWEDAPQDWGAAKERASVPPASARDWSAAKERAGPVPAASTGSPTGADASAGAPARARPALPRPSRRITPVARGALARQTEAVVPGGPEAKAKVPHYYSVRPAGAPPRRLELEDEEEQQQQQV